MELTIRKHAGAALVAVSITVAALFDGSFDPTAYAAASILIWAAVIAGLVGRALPAAPIAGTAAVAGLCLGALALLAGLSIGWAGDQGRAFEEAVRWSAYLGLFVLAAGTASDAGRSAWLSGLAAGLGAVSVVALVSYLQPGLLEGDELDRLIPTAAGQASFPIGYWNGLGALLASAAVLLAWWGAQAGARAARAGAVAVLPLALLGIWLTSSRGGGAAAVIGLAVVVLASPRPRRQLAVLGLGAVAGAALIVVAGQFDSLTSDVVDDSMRADGDAMTVVSLIVALAAGGLAWLLDGREVPLPRLSSRVRLAIAAVVAVGAVVAIAAADPAEHFEDFRSPPEREDATAAAVSDDLNSSGRWQFWTAAVDAFESEPVTGIGAGAYQDWWAQKGTIPVYVRNPHSLPLQQAAELGLAGTLVLAGFAVAVGMAAWRRLRSERDRDGGVLVALVAVASLGIVLDWTWAIPAVAAPGLIAAALLTASAPSRPIHHAYWLGLATVVVAWVSVIAAGLVVLEEQELKGSREAAAADRLDEAAERAEQATTVQPWSAEPYLQLALLAEERGDLGEALRRLRQAQERDSEDWRLSQIEARLQQRMGNDAAAAVALIRVAQLTAAFGGRSGH